MEKTDKPPVCFWVKLLFGIIKTLIKQRLNDNSLTEKNLEELVELTKKIIDASKQIKEKTTNMCGLRYKYITGATHILKLSREDFPERKDLFCEVMMC